MDKAQFVSEHQFSQDLIMNYCYTALSLCLTTFFSRSYFKFIWVQKQKTDLNNYRTMFFTDQLPFLLPNQQYQITEQYWYLVKYWIN